MDLTLRQAVYETLKTEMAAREDLIILGEDICEYGGAFAVTRDLHRHWPDRVLDVPISENGYVGVGVGAAMSGLRVVVELMFMDFITLAMDQIVNHACKIHYMYAGQVSVPIVIRAPFGGRRGYGPSHSQSLESWFMSVPGVKVVVPSSPVLAAGTLRSAIADGNPVLFLEHKLLYDMREQTDREALARPWPIGKGRILQPGDDLSILTYGYGTVLARAAAHELARDGVSAEIVDLVTLKPYDRDLVEESVTRTGKAVFVEEGVRMGGVGAEVMAELAERCMDVLDGRLVRVGAHDLPVPASRVAEDMVLPSVADIVAAARRAREL